MNTSATTGGEFWRGLLAGGGFTSIPRWTTRPAAGIGEYTEPVGDDLAAALRGLAEDMSVSVSSVLLGVHGKVLAALSGEPRVLTGYRVPGGPAGGVEALPCRLTTEPASWRTVLKEAHRVESELLAHRDFPLAELRRELGLTAPMFETEFAAGVEEPADAEPGPNTVLSVAVLDDGVRLALRLRYRLAVVDTETAARIAGYHLSGLAALVGDPDADHARHSLLAADELDYQLEGLAGPTVPLPPYRLHELFEQRVAAHPDAVAAVRGADRLSYAELNARANKIARTLLARGLRREDVVAVACERNLDWMASVLAIFKAGGAYLPIEPHFPADRIATTLGRAGCRLVLTEAESTANLDPALAALPQARRLFVSDAWSADVPGHDLGLQVAVDQLAYIYFTSGSTGEPKGAMCEHEGMLNHVYAKIDDLGVTEGAVVAQTAPQCFDISLWQLVAALLVGGHTLLVPQDVVLDVERYVETIRAGGVNVLQVVPSYLEAVLSHLEANPCELPALRCVSTTGEALKKELTQRWFGVNPGIALANAYGLTETSDDTNHEVMYAVPDTDRVPLGPAVRNVRVYVVDEHLAPVPLGAPGEIVFAGMCVGRGYVNDPERTRAAFLADPYQPGRRLYRSGDYGRWLPDGKLEFLGRRDAQIKLSGFRIEIGEIENRLLRAPGVRDGAVVVAGVGAGRHLVGFYQADQRLEVDALRATLAEALPEYMVPTVFHWRESLPLTGNGKIDKKSLTALAAELGGLGGCAAAEAHEAPRTATEQRVAAAWAGVLGTAYDRIGRLDHFFDRGGTSLSAVKLAIALNRAVSLKDITNTPVLSELAAKIDAAAG